MTRKRENPEYREWNRVYQNAWYHANKASALATRKQRIARLRHQYQQYKEVRGCARCPETHVACIEFHHEDPSSKDVNPSELINDRGWSWERIKAELDKLTSLCANCHRKEHARLRSLVGDEQD